MFCKFKTVALHLKIKGFIIINVIDVDCRKLWKYKGFRWGGVYVTQASQNVFLLKIEGASGIRHQVKIV